MMEALLLLTLLAGPAQLNGLVHGSDCDRAASFAADMDSPTLRVVSSRFDVPSFVLTAGELPQHLFCQSLRFSEIKREMHSGKFGIGGLVNVHAGKSTPSDVAGSLGSWQMAGSHRVPGVSVEVANHAEARDVSPDGWRHVRAATRTTSAADDSSTLQVGLMGRYVPEPAGMLGRPAPQESPDDRASRLDLGLGIISLSAAMIATGLTASCLAAKTCRELVPLTRWAFDRGPVWGVTGRAAVNGLIHYGVARWVPKGKWRTTTLAVLAAINVTNAVLDIRTLQKIEQDR